MTWQFNGTELTLVETATWGSVISFEIPDSEGEVAELYYSRGVDRLAEVRLGAELYRFEYDSNEEIVDIVLENAGSRRALQFQSEAPKDPHLPAWMSPSTIEGAMTSRITCDNCNDIISGVCFTQGVVCGKTGKIVQSIASFIFGPVGATLSTVVKFTCKAVGVLCDLNDVVGIIAGFDVCERIVCCGERSRCGLTCHDTSTDKCCDNRDLIPINECCSDEVSRGDLLPYVNLQVLPPRAFTKRTYVPQHTLYELRGSL